MILACNSVHSVEVNFQKMKCLIYPVAHLLEDQHLALPQFLTTTCLVFITILVVNATKVRIELFYNKFVISFQTTINVPVVRFQERTITVHHHTECRDTPPIYGRGNGCWGLLLDPPGTLVLICVCWTSSVELERIRNLLSSFSRCVVNYFSVAAAWCM